MTLQEREQHAKKVVNGIRKEHGLRALGKLKRGIPQHQRMCTLALSLEGTGVLWEHPAFFDLEIENFVSAYDNGKYPHLELPKTPVKIKYAGDRKSTVIE